MNWLELLGYLASFIVLISLLMSSIIKLRWINLVGSGIFSLYGFLIGALPVGFMNLCIAVINIYYLVKIYSSKEYFKLLHIERTSPFFDYFLDFYSQGIAKYNNMSSASIGQFDIGFYILRNLVPAGVFIASKHDENTLKVELDFVIPEYRDFKIGNYIYENSKKYFLNKGFTRFICYASNNDHIKYLKKMGFEEAVHNDNKYFVKSIA